MKLIIALAMTTNVGAVDLAELELGPFPSMEECERFQEVASPGIEQMLTGLYSSGSGFTIYRSLDETPLRVTFRCDSVE